MDARRESLREMLSDWRARTAAAGPAADLANMPRLRVFGLTVALLNVLHVLWIVLATPGDLGDPDASRWRVGLLWTHGVMAAVMVAGAGFAHRTLRTPTPGGVLRLLGVGFGLLGLLCASAIAVVDQWVTPNITPFVLSALVISFLLRLRPLDAALVLGINGVAFVAALGLTQSDPALLFSNRLNTLGVTLAAWGLSVALWHGFLTITQQQRALGEVQEALEARNRELHELAQRDGLTGLYNRQTIIARAGEHLARGRRSGSPMALLLIDIDHFKRINDTHGHPAGDAALRQVSDCLREGVRGTDDLGRFGGEEFLVVLPDTTTEGARVAAEKLRSLVEQEDAVADGLVLRTTISVGVASTDTDAHATFAALYAAADGALYAAKEGGRNAVRVGDASAPDPRAGTGASPTGRGEG